MSKNDVSPAVPFVDAPSPRSWLEALEDFSNSEDSSSDYSDESSDDDDEDDTLSSVTEEWLHGIPATCHSDEPLSTCWRMDPDESYSDYTIIIQREGGQTDTYHVHKVFLAVGHCQSQYLSALFAQKGNFVENKHNQSSIDLTDKAADAFPILLDLIYSQGTVNNISTETVLEVLYLADYFDAPALRQKANDFVKEDLSMQNAHLYYKNASFCLHHNAVIQLVEQLLVSNIMDFQPDHEILDILTVESMMEVIASESHLESEIACPRGPGGLTPPKVPGNPPKYFTTTLRTKPNTSHHVSKLVCAFIEKHDISVEDFGLLTQEEYLPFLDSTAAIKLVELEETKCGVEKFQETPLKRRCFEVLQNQLHDVDFEDSDNEVLVFLRRHPSAFAVDILFNYIELHRRKGIDVLREKAVRDCALTETSFVWLHKEQWYHGR